MAQPTPRVQILDKSDYTKQVLVSLPGAHPLPPLAAGNIRVQSRILSVTTNNFTYARLGHLLGWWDVWDLIPSLPAPYNDTAKYGRVSSWGYAEVTESLHERVPVGTKLFGYMPIGDYPELLDVTIDSETGYVLEVSERRKHLMTIYNRYLPFPPDTDLKKDKDSRGWDSVMQVLFETSYMLNRYAFSWDEKRSHPMGVPAPWSEDDADLTDTVAILLGPSGKTGLAFAHQLRRARPAGKQPKKVVAVGSEASRRFTENTGLFDEVFLYRDWENPGVLESLGVAKDTKVLVVNFSARGNSDSDWFEALKGRSDRVKALLVGEDPTLSGRPKLAVLATEPGSGVYRGNASTLRDKCVSLEGPSAYISGFSREWARFKENGTVPGLRLEWGRGIGELKEGWDALSNGSSDPTSGLVYEL